MPPKKNSAVTSKASTNTPRPRGRAAPKKVFKSAELIDDGTEEVVGDSDENANSIKTVTKSTPKAGAPLRRGRTATRKAVGSDDEQITDGVDNSDWDMRSVKSTTSARSRSRSAAGGAKSIMNMSDDDNDAVSMKSVASSINHPRPRAVSKSKSKSVKGMSHDHSINIDTSSDDDVKSIKSTKSTKSAMSVDGDDLEWVTTPPRRSRTQVPKTPSASRTSSVNRKRSASLMVSPITDEESVDMLPSPSKSVRFNNAVPLKGVLKKPEVIIPISKSRTSKRIYSGWGDDSDDVFAPESPSKKASKSVSERGSDPEDLGSAFEDSVYRPVKSIRLAKGKLVKKRSFDDDVFLEDLEQTSRGAPDVDETNVGNRDPLLARSYKGLPKLRKAFIQSWSHKPAMLPSYSDILEKIPRINKKFLEQAVLFSGVGSIRNLARSDPASLSTGFGSQSYIHAVGGNTPLTFVSTVVVGECYLIDPKSINNKTQKLIEGAGIEGEWDRLVGVIGQVINQDVYKAQIQAGYLQFATMFSSGDSVVSSPSTGFRRASGPNPFTRGPSTVNSVSHSCHDTIPIYDARKVENSFYDVVVNLGQLKRIDRELPPGSCAVVAYTANTWGKDLPINVSFNVKWAMLLGVPARV